MLNKKQLLLGTTLVALLVAAVFGKSAQNASTGSCYTPVPANLAFKAATVIVVVAVFTNLVIAIKARSGFYIVSAALILLVTVLLIPPLWFSLYFCITG